MLTSWKEVASYLGKGIRTVQRWEADLDLPIRRPNGETRRICVSPDELDRWWETHWSATRGEYEEVTAAHTAEVAALRKSLSELRAENERLRQQLNAILRGNGRGQRIEPVLAKSLRLVQTSRSIQQNYAETVRCCRKVCSLLATENDGESTVSRLLGGLTSQRGTKDSRAKRKKEVSNTGL